MFRDSVITELSSEQNRFHSMNSRAAVAAGSACRCGAGAVPAPPLPIVLSPLFNLPRPARPSPPYLEPRLAPPGERELSLSGDPLTSLLVTNVLMLPALRRLRIASRVKACLLGRAWSRANDERPVHVTTKPLSLLRLSGIAIERRHKPTSNTK